MKRTYRKLKQIFELPAILLLWLALALKTVYGAAETWICKRKADLYHHYDGYRYYVWRADTGEIFIRNTHEIAAINRKRAPKDRISIDRLLTHAIYITK